MDTKRKKENLAVVLALLVIAFFFTITTIFFSSEPFSLSDSLSLAGDNSDTSYLLEDGADVEIRDVEVGNGAELKEGMLVSAHYVGALPNGQVFDDSTVRGEPIQFVFGGNQIIPGWERGLAGARVGGTRLLFIPPKYAYGEEGFGPIPPNTPLLFEVRILGAQFPGS